MTESIERSIVIGARCEAVWRALTEISSIEVWMGEPEMALEGILRRFIEARADLTGGGTP